MRHDDLDRNVRRDRRTRVGGNAGSDDRGACDTTAEHTVELGQENFVTGCLKAAPPMSAVRPAPPETDRNRR